MSSPMDCLGVQVDKSRQMFVAHHVTSVSVGSNRPKVHHDRLEFQYSLCVFFGGRARGGQKDFKGLHVPTIA